MFFEIASGFLVIPFEGKHVNSLQGAASQGSGPLFSQPQLALTFIVSRNRLVFMPRSASLFGRAPDSAQLFYLRIKA